LKSGGAARNREVRLQSELLAPFDCLWRGNLGLLGNRTARYGVSGLLRSRRGDAGYPLSPVAGKITWQFRGSSEKMTREVAGTFYGWFRCFCGCLFALQRRCGYVGVVEVILTFGLSFLFFIFGRKKTRIPLQIKGFRVRWTLFILRRHCGSVLLLVLLISCFRSFVAVLGY
jgi:hypothetical protein